MTEWQQLAGESGSRRYRGTIYTYIHRLEGAVHAHPLAMAQCNIFTIPVLTAVLKIIDVIAGF